MKIVILIKVEGAQFQFWWGFNSMKGYTFWFCSIWRFVILQFCHFLRGSFQFYGDTFEIWFVEEDSLVLDHCTFATKTCQGMSKIHLTVSCVSHFYVRKYTFWKKCLFEGFVILHFVTHNVSFQNGMLKKHVFVCRRYCHHAKEVKRCSIELFFQKKKKCNTRFERVFRL